VEGAFSDEYFMRQAIALAYRAFEEDEVPVGAVVVSENRVIGKGYNQTEKLRDVTAHAEMLALTSAFSRMNSKYLKDCTLYVTLEPCVMCAGAFYWAQISRVVYGAKDEKRGYSLLEKNILHPKTEAYSGVLAKESEELLKTFFARRRQ
jgi:tRNA(adenine34) deaminase